MIKGAMSATGYAYALLQLPRSSIINIHGCWDLRIHITS